MGISIPTGSDLEEVKDAINILILVCMDNPEFRHYEAMMHKVEADIEILSYEQSD